VENAELPEPRAVESPVEVDSRILGRSVPEKAVQIVSGKTKQYTAETVPNWSPAGLHMHIDRGSEYTSGEFRGAIGKLNLRQSMGRTGICRDNAAAEGLFGLLKAEIGTTAWESREAVRADVFRFSKVEYNRTGLRKHPEFGYLTPVETRARLRQDLAPAG
jgi:transposase InsO family protein